jgi:purine-nucleoside phosphorylase
MNIHLAAKPGDIAKYVIISGDPFRIKHMAEAFLTDSICFNTTRGMLGFTGFYQGRRISMLGTGMGIPSTAIYVHELIHHYGVKTIVRCGTIGVMLPDMELGELVIAISAATDSAFNKITFNGHDFAPTADFSLLEQAVNICRSKQKSFRVAQVLSTDRFYSEDANRFEPWIRHGVAGAEMETSVLYTLGARNKVRSLAILSVSDNIITGATLPAINREQQLHDMFQVALELI